MQNRYTSRGEIGFYIFGDDGYLKDIDGHIMLFVEPVKNMRQIINNCYKRNSNY